MAGAEQHASSKADLIGNSTSTYWTGTLGSITLDLMLLLTVSNALQMPDHMYACTCKTYAIDISASSGALHAQRCSMSKPTAKASPADQHAWVPFGGLERGGVIR